MQSILQKKYRLFEHNPRSPVLLEVKTIDSISDYLALFFFIPGFLTYQEHSTYIRYGSGQKFIEKEFRAVKRVYLPIPFFSFMSALLFSGLLGPKYEFLLYEAQEKKFLLTLRDEIAKIAPLADPDSETPQTVDLPTTGLLHKKWTRI
jgi:hypothetical protein